MPSSLYRRRRSLIQATSLNGLASRDGAVVWYNLATTTGTEANQGSGGTAYDLTSGNIHAQVTRGVAAPGRPDQLGWNFLSTSQGASTFGHALATRPDQSTFTKVSWEVVARVTTASQTGKVLLKMHTETVPAAYAYVNNNANMAVFIPLTGGFESEMTGTATTILSWFHLVWLYDGTDFYGYINGQQNFKVTTTIGAATLFDSTTKTTHFGGDQGTGASNLACDIGFYASYQGIALSPQQVAAHYRASGV